MIKIGRLLQLLALIMVAAGAQPAMSAFWQWSKTAATNSTADPTINWAEGMSPSSVNDSARAMMARAAEYRDDTSGGLNAAGGPVAFTVVTNQGLSAVPSVGLEIAFRLPVNNGDASTLAADGGPAYPIQTSPGVAVPSGSMVALTPYRVTFNVASSAWVLQSFYSNPYSIPLGGILWSTLPTAPNSAFVAPSGQCISTTTYAAYWVARGSPASGVCLGGQFQIIDMRGYTVAALDTLNASAAGRMTNSATGCGTAFTSIGAVCANGNQSSTILTANLPPYTPVGTITNGAITITGNGTAALSGTASDVTPGSVLGAAAGSLGASQAPSTFTGTAALGQVSTPMSRVPPTIGLIPYLRIL